MPHCVIVFIISSCCVISRT